jgi:hypothetical protein
MTDHYGADPLRCPLDDDPQDRTNRWTDGPERVEVMRKKLAAIRAMSGR